MRGPLLCAVSLLVATACGPPPARWKGPPPGEDRRPYNALPEYLIVRPPPPVGGNVGRWDARVPVAGMAWNPSTVRLDEVRLRLAQIDAEVTRLRYPEATPSPRQPVAGGPVPAPNPASPSQGLLALAARLRDLVADRPDLAEEANELAGLAQRLDTQLPALRGADYDRINQLVDIIRIQIAATTPNPPTY